MTTTTLYLVRHGEASADDDADRRLSTAGRRQAGAVADRLLSSQLDPAPSAVLHSSRRRAVETATIVATRLGLAPEHSDDLEDRTPVPRDLTNVPQRYHDFLRAVPDAELDVDGARLDAAVETLGLVGAADRTIVAVTHAFVVAWFVRDALDTPAWRWVSLPIGNASLTVIRWSDEHEPRVICVNDTGHLA